MNVQSVILAAGLSSRIGQNKMLLPIKEKTVIEHCIEAFAGACSKIIVVTGKDDDRIRAVLKPYLNVFCIYNPNYEQGMFTSVKAGIEQVDSGRFFLTPGDYPLLKSETIHLLLRTQAELAQPVCQGTRGHPLLLSQTLIPLILKSNFLSLRQCLNALPLHRCSVAVDDIGVITDLDTMDAYDEILQQFNRTSIFHSYIT